MFKQVLYVVITMGVISGILIFSKEKVKSCFAVAIFLTPFQGGLWIEGLFLDILMPNLILFAVTVIIISKHI